MLYDNIYDIHFLAPHDAVCSLQYISRVQRFTVHFGVLSVTHEGLSYTDNL